MDDIYKTFFPKFDCITDEDNKRKNYNNKLTHKDKDKTNDMSIINNNKINPNHKTVTDINKNSKNKNSSNKNHNLKNSMKIIPSAKK